VEVDSRPPPGEGVGKGIDLMPIRNGIEVSFGYMLIMYLRDYVFSYHQINA
jgi:hypothetical protein